MSAIFYRISKIFIVIVISASLSHCGGGENSSQEKSYRVGAPLNFGSVAGNEVVLLTWRTPNSVGKADYYVLEKSIDQQNSFAIVNGNIPATAVTFTDSTAQNDVAHVYRLAAVNELGLGDWAVGDAVTPKASLAIDLPGVPKNVIAKAGNGSVTITWQAPDPDTGGMPIAYQVARTIGDKPITFVSGKIPANTTRFTDPNAVNGLVHTYYVSATNSRGFFGKQGASNAVIPLNVVSGLPIAPQKFTAIAGDSSVTLTWIPAAACSATSYFKLDKSIDNKKIFTPVEAQLPCETFTFTELALTNGDSYVYSIIAGNEFDVSSAVESNIAIPTLGNASTTRSTLVSNKPGKYNTFGNAVAFSADGKTLVIAENGRNATQSSRPGLVQIFTNVNNSWNYSQTLNTSATGITNLYGFTVALSPDGSVLAVGGEYNSVTGDTVYLYTKPVDSWIELQTISLSSANGITSTGFGNSLSFNAGKATLAIGEKNGIVKSQKTGAVHIYSADANNVWTPLEIITAKVPTLNNEFGAVVRFSPDGNSLAIGETKGDTATILDAGLVHLFTKPVAPVINWTYLASLESKNPQTGNLFAANNNGIVFSPDSLTLAIGETKGELLAGAANAGTVNIFTKTAGIWSTTATVLTAPATATKSAVFGNAVSFSSDGLTVAIGERNGGAAQVGIVHLYTLATAPNSTWLFSKRLTAVIPGASNRFGSSVVFNPVGSTLAVSEIKADSKTLIDTGAVDIIELKPGL